MVSHAVQMDQTNSGSSATNERCCDPLYIASQICFSALYLVHLLSRLHPSRDSL